MEIIQCICHMPQNIQNHPTLSPWWPVIMGDVVFWRRRPMELDSLSWYSRPVGFFAWSWLKVWETLTNGAWNIVAVKVIFFNGSKVCWVHCSSFVSEVDHAMSIMIFLYLLWKSDRMSQETYPGARRFTSFRQAIACLSHWTIFQPGVTVFLWNDRRSCVFTH